MRPPVQMPDYHTVIRCDSDDCLWNRGGVCGRGQVSMLEYRFKNRNGRESNAVVCENRSSR